jgi:hypothetical protein
MRKGGRGERKKVNRRG